MMLWLTARGRLMLAHSTVSQFCGTVGFVVGVNAVAGG
jgi:hypothetical protein